MEEPAALEAFRQAPQEIHRPSRSDLAVIVEPRDGHGRAPSARASSQSWTRRDRLRSRLPAYGSMAWILAANVGRPSPRSTQAGKSLRFRPRRIRASIRGEEMALAAPS